MSIPLTGLNPIQTRIFILFSFSVGDEYQAIQLEDGSTAFISQSSAPLSDGSYEVSTISLDNLQSQVDRSTLSLLTRPATCESNVTNMVLRAPVMRAQAGGSS